MNPSIPIVNFAPKPEVYMMVSGYFMGFMKCFWSDLPALPKPEYFVGFYTYCFWTDMIPSLEILKIEDYECSFMVDDFKKGEDFPAFIVGHFCCLPRFFFGRLHVESSVDVIVFSVGVVPGGEQK